MTLNFIAFCNFPNNFSFNISFTFYEVSDIVGVLSPYKNIRHYDKIWGYKDEQGAFPDLKELSL